MEARDAQRLTPAADQRAGPTEEPQAPPPAAAGTLTRAPELVELVPAPYPAEAAAAGVAGEVLLSIVIDAVGEVQQVLVVDPGPSAALARAALHAAARFRFRPAEIDGRPAAVEIGYRYAFTLRPPTAASTGAVPPPAPATAPGEDGGRGAEAGVGAGTYEAVVRGTRGADATVRTLARAEIQTVAGTQGDLLKVLQNLPGVARSPFGIGLLVVRGSEPQDTNVYLDGIPIPLLFHFGGVTAVVSSGVADGIDFYPGNFGARFGRALGGSAEIRSRPGSDRFHGAAQVDVFDGSAQVEGPIGPGTALVSIRRSWIDAALAVALPRVAPDEADELRIAPRYHDYQARYEAPLLGGTATLLAFGSHDRFEFVRGSDDSGRPTLSLATGFHRGALRWDRTFGPTVSNRLLVAAGRDRIDVTQSNRLGLATRIDQLVLRDALAWAPGGPLSLELGVDAVLRDLAYDVYAPPLGTPGAIGGSGETSAATVTEAARHRWSSPAVWLEAAWRPRDDVRMVAGLRGDRDSRLRAAGWLDPRLTAFWEARRGTTLSAAAGLFGSAPAPQETSRAFGNPALGPQRALHLSAGASQQLPAGLEVEATGWYKRLWALVVPTQDLDAAGDPLRYANTGRGRAYGLELLLRRGLGGGLSGWLAYTLSRSERLDDPTLRSDPAWHPFAFDQTHVLAAVLSWRLQDGWILGTRVRGVTGSPYTPPAASVYDADSGRYHCVPSAAVNGRRLPGFFQADARIDKRFAFDAWALSLYLDVQNVTNHANTELRLEGFDCSDTVPIASLPIVPALGLRAEW